MIDQGSNSLHRREFLQTSAATAAMVAAGGAGYAQAQEAEAAKTQAKELPTRVLGKTGVKVSILNQGTWQNPALDRLVRYSFANGVRYYDAARSYGSEPGLAKWFQAMPEVRKQIFLVTKDTPREPNDMLRMLDERLAQLQTDYVDLFFIHALGDHGAHEVEWPKDPAFKTVFDKIRKSGKAKFVGFSTHHARRPEILQNAAKGGFVDAIMLQYSPFLDKDSDLNKAIDACHKANIGLISMKQIAGRSSIDEKTEPIAHVLKNMPELKEKKLTPYQILLHGIWSDERISSVCVSMRNTKQIEENTLAARNYKEPLKQSQLDQLRDAFVAAGPTLCADCDGSCSRAGKTKASLGDLTRFLTYHEHHGYRGVAREMYAQLSEEARDWAGADLDAAREACPHKLDFAKLLPKVDRYLA